QSHKSLLDRRRASEGGKHSWLATSAEPLSIISTEATRARCDYESVGPHSCENKPRQKEWRLRGYAISRDVSRGTRCDTLSSRDRQSDRCRRNCGNGRNRSKPTVFRRVASRIHRPLPNSRRALVTKVIMVGSQKAVLVHDRVTRGEVTERRTAV